MRGSDGTGKREGDGAVGVDREVRQQNGVEGPGSISDEMVMRARAKL